MNAGGNVRNDVSQPIEGYPLPMRLPECELVLWWGPDVDGEDRVAVEGGRVLVWGNIEECLANVRERGLAPALSDAEEVPNVMDFGPIVAWLRGRRLTLDPVAALNLWNLAGDVALSLGKPWDDTGRIADACHAKLTAANLPWLVEPTNRSLRWTAPELRYLRRRMQASLSLLRGAVGA